MTSAPMLVDGTRKAEILETAATMFATRGVRTSLQEIADAAGILPGSLYHHFASKDAIIVELIERYQADLDLIARRALDETGRLQPSRDRIVALATAIAECAVRHRAALLLTFYEPPAGASDEFVRLARRTPSAVGNAMFEMLRIARTTGEIRTDADLRLLADRITQAMLHIGIGVSHQTPGGEQVPGLRCSILLDGLAVRTPADATLNRSRSMRAADDVIASWSEREHPAGGGDRAELLRVARAEFARRGYDATTVRDIAAAAGLSTGAVYRRIRSKGELLVAIMRAYAASVNEGWDRVLRAKSSAVERLDALMWFNINVLDRFAEEYKIQSALLSQSPPSNPNLGMSFSTQLRRLRSVLAEGLRKGELHVEKAPADMRARSVFAVVWTPENIVRGEGTRGALAFGRETVLRGVAKRR